MRYLLDTHTFLWLALEPSRVPDQLRHKLALSSAQIFVSAATPMEVATKVRIGKLDYAAALLQESSWAHALQQYRADELPISSRHSLLAGAMAWENRDPFDRFLAAQAIVEKMPLVTVDHAFDTVPSLTTLWN